LNLHLKFYWYYFAYFTTYPPWKYVRQTQEKEGAKGCLAMRKNLSSSKLESYNEIQRNKAPVA